MKDPEHEGKDALMLFLSLASMLVQSKLNKLVGFPDPSALVSFVLNVVVRTGTSAHKILRFGLATNFAFL